MADTHASYIHSPLSLARHTQYQSIDSAQGLLELLSLSLFQWASRRRRGQSITFTDVDRTAPVSTTCTSGVRVQLRYLLTYHHPSLRQAWHFDIA